MPFDPGAAILSAGAPRCHGRASENPVQAIPVFLIFGDSRAGFRDESFAPSRLTTQMRIIIV